MTVADLRMIRKVVRDVHAALAVDVLGPAAVSRRTYRRLVASGMVSEGAGSSFDMVADAWELGSAAGRGAGGVGSAQVRARLTQHVRELQHRLDDAVSRVVIERAPADVRDVLVGVRVAAAAVQRDWFRVVHTEVHNAVELAKAEAIAGSSSRDVRVYKRPRPDACAYCKLLYLRPDGKTPRVFRLDDLLAAGTNAGRRAGSPTRSGRSRTQWRAVVGAVHPFCTCELSVIGAGHTFDAEGRLVHTGVGKALDAEPVDLILARHDCVEP